MNFDKSCISVYIPLKICLLCDYLGAICNSKELSAKIFICHLLIQTNILFFIS